MIPMLHKLANFHPVTLRARLFVAFVVIGILAATGIIFFTTLADFRGEQEEAVQKLDAIATLKHAELDYWYRYAFNSLAMLFTETNMNEDADIVSTQPPSSLVFQQAYAHLQDDFSNILLQRLDLFDKIFLVNREGRVVLSTDAQQEGTFVGDQNYFRDGWHTDVIDLVTVDMAGKHDALIAAHPLIDEHGRTYCIIAGEIRMTPLSKIMGELSGLGETGKTYLVDNDFEILTTPRFPSDVASLHIAQTKGVQNVFASHADGYDLYDDYRGVPVVGAYRWIPELKVALLAEQDQAEAFSHVYTKFKVSVAIVSAVLLLTVLVARQLIRDITLPLSELAGTATQISAGNLALAANVAREDEIGALAHAFNTMTTRLREVIQQLKEQVAELERAEQRNRHLASFPQLDPNPVIEVDVAGQVIFFNPATQRILENLGLTPNAVKLFLPDDWEHILKAWSGKSDALVERVIEIQDRIFTASIFLSSQLNVVRIYALDITARARAEEQLRKLSSAVEQSPVTVVITDPAGCIEYVNPNFTQTTGYTPAEVLGKNPRILKSGETCPETYRELWQTILAGKEWHGEFHNRKKNGELYWEAARISPIFDAYGKITHLMAVKEDITERKRTEAALRESEQMLSVIFEKAAYAVSLSTFPDGRLVNVNESWEKIFGYAKSEAFGKTTRELNINLDIDQREDIFKHLQEQMNVRDLEMTLRTQTGDWRTFLVNIDVVTIGGQKYLLNMAQDITERKLADQALRDARDELEVRVRERTVELQNVVRQLRDEIAERQRVQDLVWQHAARGETLTRVAASLNAHLGLDAVLNAVCEETARAMNVPIVNVCLYNPTTNVLEWAATFGEPSEFGKRVQPVAHAEYQVYAGHSNAIVIVPDLQAIAGARNRELYTAFDIRTGVSASLAYEDKPIGVLNLFTTQRVRQFSENELALLRGLMRQAAQAITNARLYQAESNARSLAETVTAASLALTQSLNLDIVLETLLDSIVRLVPYDSANVMLVDAESQLSVRALRGYEKYTAPELTRAIKFDVHTNPILQRLIETRQSILVADTENDPAWQKVPGAGHVRSWLGVPLVAGGNVVGVYSLDKTKPGFFTESDKRLVEALAAQAAVAVQNAWLFEQLRADRARLESLSRRLVEVQESERRYVASELHDEAGQLLTGLKFGLRVLERNVDSPALLNTHLAGLRQMVDDVLENLHRLAMQLRPATLDRLGLVAALREYAETTSAKHKLAIEFETVGFDSGERLSLALETTLYRIVQEALTNIVRHAQANRVQIILERLPNCVRATIDDNGVGFDYPRAIQSGRLGLLGMKERVEMFNGTLAVESTPGEGTTLTIEVPNGNSYSDRR
jgi:PAS domain S-box-containing protein